MKKIFALFYFLNCIFFSYCKFEAEPNYDLTLNLVEIADGNYGLVSVIAFKTNSSTTVDIYETDIENQIVDTYFIQRTMDEKEYKVSVECFLWKPKEENIYVFCRIPFHEDNIRLEYSDIKLEEFIINYKEKTIKIVSEDFLEINFVQGYYPFLYADKQVIDFNDDKNVYELKFKIGLYDEHRASFQLYNPNNKIKHYINIKNDCIIEKNELICKIYRDIFEGHLLTKEQSFTSISAGYLYGMTSFPFIRGITIKYDTNKENKYNKIRKQIC